MASVNGEELDQLILDIHAAPLARGSWPNVLERLRCAVRADRALLFSAPASGRGPFWNISVEMDPAGLSDYAIEYAREDPWIRAATQLPAPTSGLCTTGEQLVDRRDFLRSRFYGEFLRLHDIGRLLSLTLRERPYAGAPPEATLSFYRGLKSQAFGPEECAVLCRVRAHLILALETFWNMQAMSINHGALRETIDAVNVAVFLIDRDGRLVFENSAADRSIRQADILVANGGFLLPAPTLKERVRVQNLLHTVRAGRSGRLRLAVGPQRAEVMLCAAPLSAVREPVSGACAMVWISALARPGGGQHLAALFGLSAAEQRLIAALCAGESLAQAADSFHLSIHTVRGQLKSIQRKTGWRTQSELVRRSQLMALIDPDSR